MKKKMALRLYPQVIRNSGREIQCVLVAVTPVNARVGFSVSLTTEKLTVSLTR